MSTTINNAAPQELIKRIEGDIRKTGFPLEVHVLNVCSTRNTGRMPSVRYEYLNELREIDLLAFFETIELSSKGHTNLQHTTTDLIIECKKSSEKPWVFFSSPSYAFENVAFFLKYASEFDLHFSKRNLPPLLAQIFTRIKKSHYVDPTLPRCIGYYEAFRGTAGPSEIYRAIDSVITYLCYRRQSRMKRREEFGVYSEFYLPVIVLDGFLFEASVNQAEIEVKERSHLQLRTFHRNEIYIIDVVTRGHFQQFFDEVALFHDELVSDISSLKFPLGFKVKARTKVREDRRSATGNPDIRMMKADAKRRAEALRKAHTSKATHTSK